MATALRLTVIAALLSWCLGCDKHTFACHTNGVEAGCSILPVRKPTSVIIRVYIDDQRVCSVDSQSVPCSDVGRRIRSAHPLDDPTVTVCAARNVTYDVLGSVLSTMSREYLTVRFGCSSSDAPGAT